MFYSYHGLHIPWHGGTIFSLCLKMPIVTSQSFRRQSVGHTLPVGFFHGFSSCTKTFVLNCSCIYIKILKYFLQKKPSKYCGTRLQNQYAKGWKQNELCHFHSWSKCTPKKQKERSIPTRRLTRLVPLNNHTFTVSPEFWKKRTKLSKTSQKSPQMNSIWQSKTVHWFWIHLASASVEWKCMGHRAHLVQRFNIYSSRSQREQATSSAGSYDS